MHTAVEHSEGRCASHYSALLQPSTFLFELCPRHVQWRLYFHTRLMQRSSAPYIYIYMRQWICSSGLLRRVRHMCRVGFAARNTTCYGHVRALAATLQYVTERSECVRHVCIQYDCLCPRVCEWVCVCVCVCVCLCLTRQPTTYFCGFPQVFLCSCTQPRETDF